MKALVHTAPYVVQLQEWDVPTYGPDDLLVRVKACAICGSDIKGYTGKTGRRQPPIIMGHEASGVVEAVGANVMAFESGDRVCFDSTVYCRRCAYCQSGRPNMCESRQVVGVSEGTYRRHGAMAEYVVVPYWIAVRMPDRLSFAQAALVETVSISVHAANRTPVRLNDTVVVVGVGAIGLTALQAIRLKGAGRVIVTDLSPWRLDLARQLGADVAIRADQPDLLERLRDATGPEGADAVVEAVGIQETVDTALEITRKGGSLTLIGNVTPRVELGLQSIVFGEIAVRGTCASSGEFPDCVTLVASGRIIVDPLITEHARLEDGQAVFDRLYQGVENSIRTVFIFD
ncbi:MAG TPA: galactitol-1-phosphate 5-dehydrogenase [Anaerolineae bacterium]|nr:galactitol-1-phosphate 5-dehydrogenase [Anaerolineae bacterium]